MAPTYPSRWHYQCTLHKNNGVRISVNVTAHQEKKDEITDKREAEESSRPISKLHAALLRSFKGYHDKTMVCIRGVPGLTGALGKANSNFDPTQTMSGTASPR